MSKFSGSIPARFRQILSTADPSIQARILEGVLQQFRVGSSLARTPERGQAINSLIARLNGVSTVSPVDLFVTNYSVEAALADAEMLIKIRGATSGVDRVHTAFHGYL